jgi:hypothetical protein
MKEGSETRTVAKRVKEYLGQAKTAANFGIDCRKLIFSVTALIGQTICEYIQPFSKNNNHISFAFCKCV